MKKSIILIGVCSIMTIQADFIDTIVSKIKAPRESNISKEKLKKLESPIIEIKKEIIQDGNKTVALNKDNLDTFVLKAIMNKKAFINNKWVTIGEKIGNYTLVDIMDDSVYLTNGKKSKMIFFKKTNKKTIQIINR